MIIKAIKEKVQQVFETQTSILQKKANIFKEEMVECAIDEEIVECEEMDSPPYTGVPAPVVLDYDPWFGAPVTSDKQEEYQQQEAVQRLHNDIRRENETSEPENIHEVMYEMATLNAPTTLQLNPVGGSETFQEGWQSGSGLLQ